MRTGVAFNIRGISFVQKTLIQSFVLIIYKLSLDLLYLKAVTPFYDYAGMTLNFSIKKYVISTILFIILVKPIVRLYNDNRVSSLILLAIHLLYFIPGCTMYAFAGFSDIYFLFFSAYWILFILLNRYLKITPIKPFDYTSNKLMFYTAIIILSAGIIYITGLYNSFNLHLGLTDVYELRFAQRKLHLPTIINYFQPIAATLVPIALVYCLINKKIVWSVILILVQLLSFAFGGMKMTFFFLVIAILAYLFYRKERSRLLTFGFILLNAVAFLELLFFNFSYVNAYIIYRVLFIPNLLSYQFYEFFNSHKLLYWRDSILNRFGFDSPYAYPVPNLIAREIYSDPNGNANNGLVGDAFSNFGWLGLLVFPFLIVAFCKLLDACTKRVDERILLAAAVIFAMGFTNGSFFVLMLSNGFLFALILLYILPRQNVSFSDADNH